MIARSGLPRPGKKPAPTARKIYREELALQAALFRQERELARREQAKTE